jgi:hypothetical protein
MSTQLEKQRAETPVLAQAALLLTDDDLAGILRMTNDWVRSHAKEIPGFTRLGSYFRFARVAVEQRLGDLEPLLEAEQVGEVMCVPKSWVYANADEIPGVLRLGRYVRFKPLVLFTVLAGSEVVQ